MDMGTSGRSGYGILGVVGVRRDAMTGPLSDKKRHTVAEFSRRIECAGISH